MSKLVLILAICSLLTFLVGCDAGTAAGGAQPADAKTGPMNKPPVPAGAGGGAPAPPVKAPGATAGPQ